MKISFPVRIYLVALILRLVPVLVTRGLGIGLDDMFQYDMLARSLASGHGFRWYAKEDLRLLEPYVEFDLSTATGYNPETGVLTSFRAPLYPAFLAIVYFLFGMDFSRFFFARLTQAILLGAPLAPLTYLVSRRLFPDGELTARASAWIVACYPMLLLYPLGLGTENLFFVLVLSSFFFLLRSIEKPSRLQLLLAGAFLGMTTLTRSVIFLFAGIAILYLLYLHGRQAIFSGIVFVLVVTPWIIRNSLLHHKITGIETSMGYNLYLGYHPQGNGSFIFGPSLDLLTIMDDSVRDEFGTRKAVEFIRGQPERFVRLAINRLGFFFGLEKRVLMYFYSNNLIGFISRPLLLIFSTILLAPFAGVALLAAFSLPALKCDDRTAILAALLAAYTLPHVFILAEDRFHLALVPFLAILAVQGWTFFADKQVRSAANNALLWFSVLLALLLLANWGIELHRDADKIARLLGPDGNQTFFPY